MQRLRPKPKPNQISLTKKITNYIEILSWGTWATQSVKHLILDLSSGLDLKSWFQGPELKPHIGLHAGCGTYLKNKNKQKKKPDYLNVPMNYFSFSILSERFLKFEVSKFLLPHTYNKDYFIHLHNISAREVCGSTIHFIELGERDRI